VPRFRTMAVAALAVSALAATSSVAYAHDLNLPRFGSQTSVASSMTWAFYTGPLIDVSPDKDVFDGARATVMMIGMNGSTFFRLNVRGVDESADGNKYPAHVHEGPCVAGDGGAAGPHYNIQKEEKLPAPYEVSAQTEVHLDFEVNSDGSARVTVNAPFVVKPGERSIVFHTDKPPVPPATSPARLACIPLNIKDLASTD
jgi:superoxide dismutase, Cu-Zn family